MRRQAVPLHKKRHYHILNAIHEHPNDDKAMSVHLGIGTGMRNNTIGHVYKDWFFYDSDGNLYIQIPGSDKCRKGNGDGTCGHCEDGGQYNPKTEAGDGRIILIPNSWHNHANEGEEEYFGLKDHVEAYFALDGKNAPDNVRYGKDMIQGNGVSKGPLNKWVRDVAAKSAIQPQLRMKRLEQAGVPNGNGEDEPKKIKDFGHDDEGNKIPDMIFHDLRACYCTQLMRNEVPPHKAINKTGHADPDSLKPYVMFAANEIDAKEEQQWY
ncbi:unknown (plasmid) [Halobacterium salinarum NRC-1]|uniref:Integrase family protein n=4 Tax=Halobacterium salinarum TaxID=2242 RepID=O51964_HALSA|nr:hypothetical protein [Halobacterium salinarum]AAC82794.1 unknown [Halobacterium salinarum NRC-1]CAP15024.1 integrase family protein [Halobacterium salinarum R1]DAC79482.1 TPA_inf: integrase family protein [Halobacterium salinarum NRC-1]DAC79686.1 TPA_inf: integrase family protein [Halobacterium salinarum NRC-1]